MGEAHNALSDEVISEVKRRLSEGEIPEDIINDDEMPSRAKVFEIKKQWEQEKEQQEELEREVFQEESNADRETIIDVLEQAGVGIKQSGEPKANVQKALNAIDFDAAWDDPHYVADTLEEEASMQRQWANRVVRKAYGMPDFPRVDTRDDNTGKSRRPNRGRESTPNNRNRRARDRDRGRDNNRDRRDDGQQSGGGDPQLRKQMQQLQSTVSELANVVADEVADDDDDDAQMVEIEQDGKTMKVPYHVAVSQGLLGNDNSDDKDFMDKLRDAKQAGIIPDPDDFQDDNDDDMFDMLEKAESLGLIGDDDSADEIEVMSEMMDEMSEQFAEAQSNVATQMSAAISQLADEQEEDEDELTVDELEDWWEEKQKEDELDRLENELKEMRKELRGGPGRGYGDNADPESDPEVVKKRIDTEHEKDQLELAKETVDSAPDRIAEGVQKGLLPLLDRMQMARGGGNPMWSAPDETQRGEPEYRPEQPDQQPQGRRDDAQQSSDRTAAESREYPQPDNEPAANGQVEPNGDDQTAQDDELAERADEVRDKLNLDEDNADEEAAA